jgi:hypothetical protein
VLTHLSIVGSLVFFFATAGFRERVFASRQSLGLEPPSPAAYVSHLQELIAHGLTTGAAAARADGTATGKLLEGAGRAPSPRPPERGRSLQRTRRA